MQYYVNTEFTQNNCHPILIWQMINLFYLSIAFLFHIFIYIKMIHRNNIVWFCHKIFLLTHILLVHKKFIEERALLFSICDIEKKLFQVLNGNYFTKEFYVLHNLWNDLRTFMCNANPWSILDPPICNSSAWVLPTMIGWVGGEHLGNHEQFANVSYRILRVLW